MSIRVRESWGTSWRDPHVPGTRHWRSHSVSAGLRWFGIGWLLWYGVVWGCLLGPGWVIIEVWALFISALIVMTGVLTGQAYWDGIFIRRAGWWWIFDLRMKP